MQRNLTLSAIPVVILAAVTCVAQDRISPEFVAEDDRPFLLNYPNLEDSDGEVVLTNEHVVLQQILRGRILRGRTDFR